MARTLGVGALLSRNLKAFGCDLSMFVKQRDSQRFLYAGERRVTRRGVFQPDHLTESLPYCAKITGLRGRCLNLNSRSE